MKNAFGIPVVTAVDDNQSTVTQELCLGNVNLPYDVAKAAGLVSTRTIFLRTKLEEGTEFPLTRIAYKESLTQGSLVIITRSNPTDEQSKKMWKVTDTGIPVRSRMVLCHESEDDVRIAGNFVDYDGDEQAAAAEKLVEDTVQA